jgi:hypothetical protein
LINDFQFEGSQFKFRAKQREFTIDFVTGNRYLGGPNTFNKKKSRSPVVVVAIKKYENLSESE